MGYTDSLNALKSDISTGKVKVTKTDTEVIYGGSIYKHKDFLKREHRGTGLHFDGATKTWRMSIEDMYDTDKALVEEVTEGSDNRITF